MKLPELERAKFIVKIDSVELELNEPSLSELEKLVSYGDISSDDPESITKLADIIASLMNSYEASFEEKKKFVKNMSSRQLMLLIDGIKISISSKKVKAESEISNS